MRIKWEKQKRLKASHSEERQMAQFPRNERYEWGFFSKTDWKADWR